MKFCECVLFAAKFSEEKEGREGRGEERIGETEFGSW